MKYKISGAIKKLILFSCLLLVIYLSKPTIRLFFSKVADFIIPDSWILFVCREKPVSSNSLPYYLREIRGYASEKECLKAGEIYYSKQGFECGSNCKDLKGVTRCKEISSNTQACSK